MENDFKSWILRFIETIETTLVTEFVKCSRFQEAIVVKSQMNKSAFFIWSKRVVF